MRRVRCDAARLVLAGIVAMLVLGAPPASGRLLRAGPVVLAVAHDSAEPTVKVTTRSVTPKVQRTVGFNGYASYMFEAPKGRRIVSASASIVGAQKRAVRITSKVLSKNRSVYTVKLEFPGEQGNPGKLVVRLGTVA